MGENPFDKLYLVTPARGRARALPPAWQKRHASTLRWSGAILLEEALDKARVNTRRGLLVCGSEIVALQAGEYMEAKLGS